MKYQYANASWIFLWDSNFHGKLQCYFFDSTELFYKMFPDIGVHVEVSAGAENNSHSPTEACLDQNRQDNKTNERQYTSNFTHRNLECKL